ncbi:mechanosensitive ion channel [Flavobacterium piscinae]|uniref:Mechanosensitive ion channel n=1 Tax=Flavobacterium piscinae TaxID=2506424 RepID=A0A4Q1KIV9_9FLAO|nr:mechanosensitive ion channel domain-containing protein [Flavobacterium piscinae]RXR28504.1 mechanosensitive ion channel [Flavobacterium piscinae]
MEFLKLYIKEEIATGIVLLFFFIARIITAKIVRRFAKISQTLEHRSNLVIKYFNILLGTIAVIAIFIIWGVKPQNVILVFSSVFAVIGVAMFAQWSILSNVTSGIILFFSAPFKIGDTIRIHDKDFPLEAEIEDIRGFHTYLKTKEGELITYPNSLLLQKGVSVLKFPSEEKEFTD